MPTYKNVSMQNRELNGKVVEPGKEICSLAYYNENEIKLLKVSDKPFYNKTILSSVVTEPSEIKIPEKDNLGIRITKFAIHFHVKRGSVDIRYNSKDNLPATLLYEDARWNDRVFERNIDKIFVKGITEKFELWIILEKL